MMAILMFVIDAALRGLIVAAIMGTLLVFLPRQSARLRLRAWTFVLYALLAMPIAGLIAPVWREVIPSVPVFDGVRALESVVIVAHTGGVVPAAEAQAVAAPGMDWPAVAAAIYFTGLAWFGFQAVLGWDYVRRLRQRSHAIDDAQVLDRVLRHSVAADLRNPPLLKQSPDLFSPVTMSVRRPIVVLPDDWASWPSEQLEGVLVHELSHVARKDALTQGLALACRAIFWFSPVVWWLQRHLSRLAELASDESALAAGVDRLAYADTLLAFFVRAQARSRPVSWHLAMARRDDANAARRIEQVLSWKGDPDMNMTRMKVILAGVGVAMAPLTILAASVQVAPATLPAIVAPIPVIGSVTPWPAPVAPRRPIGPPTAAARLTPKSTPPVQVPTSKPPAAPQLPDDDAEFLKGSFEANTPGLILPKPVQLVMPKYTAEGMRQKLQGTVVVDVIIGPEGSVTRARVKVSLDKVTGLDEAALAAARQSTFTPGELSGRPVPVHTTLELHFRLH
ncbi:MAG TPA: TonB family protein [Vicinamibacterales bacterium]|nr:TonB family protein [Vicinamibacterales bacterium]